jgi:uncharacterized protein
MARMDVLSDLTEDFSAHGEKVDALFELGLTYCTGRDGAVDLVEAHKWFNLSAMRGNNEAKRYRAEVASDMTKAEIMRAQQLARKWLATVH